MKLHRPLVTIYIVSKNYGRYLNRAIKSVFTQSYKNWELYIVDDNSTDKTKNILKKKIKFKDNKVFLLKNSSSKGLQKIANKILLLSKGKYFVRLDADDWFEPDAIKEMIKIF